MKKQLTISLLIVAITSVSASASAMQLYIYNMKRGHVGYGIPGLTVQSIENNGKPVRLKQAHVAPEKAAYVGDVDYGPDADLTTTLRIKVTGDNGAMCNMLNTTTRSTGNTAKDCKKIDVEGGVMGQAYNVFFYSTEKDTKK